MGKINKGKNVRSDGISLNNADEVLKQLNSDFVEEKSFLTLVQGNAFSGTDITEENLDANSDFIIKCWH